MSPLRPRKTKTCPENGCCKKNGLHLRTQTIETAPHVGDAGCDPDLRSCGKLDHLQRLSRMDRTSIGSAPLSTLMIARPANSM